MVLDQVQAPQEGEVACKEASPRNHLEEGSTSSSSETVIAATGKFLFRNGWRMDVNTESPCLYLSFLSIFN